MTTGRWAILITAALLICAASAGAAVTEIKADDRGHYIAKADIDGTDVTVIVDTGASLVALSYEDADDIGLKPQSLSYNSPVLTANGTVNAARVSLRRIEIDGVLVRDVEGLVLPEGAISGSLLGMRESQVPRLSSSAI